MIRHQQWNWLRASDQTTGRQAVHCVDRTKAHVSNSARLRLERHYMQPGIERVQALADISRSSLCCFSIETRAPITNPSNCAQLVGTPLFPKLRLILCSRLVWECGEGQTDVNNIHFASAMPHAKCNRTANIIVKKTSQFKTVCKDDNGYISPLKRQKY